MKSILTILAVLVMFAPPSHAGSANSLREHMRAMGYILDEVWIKAGNPANYPVAADKVRDLRGHLIQGLSYFPSKFSSMTPDTRRLAEIEFHQHAARVIYLCATLEGLLLKPEDQIMMRPSRESEIKQLLAEISTTVAKAHGKFR